MSLLFLIVACKPLTNLVRQMWFLPECHPNDYSECESNWVRGGATAKTQGSLDNLRSERMRAFASFKRPPTPPERAISDGSTEERSDSALVQ